MFDNLTTRALSPVRRLPEWLRLGAGGLSISMSLQLLGVVTGIVIARGLGPTDRGILALVFLLPTIVSYLSDLGTDKAATFFAARRDTRRDELASTLALIGTVHGLVGAAICINVGSLLLSGQDASTRQLATLAVLIVPLANLSRLGQAQLQGELRLRALSVARIAYPLLGVAILVGLALAGQLTLGNAIASRYVCEIVIVLMSWTLVLRRSGLAMPNQDVYVELVRYGIRGYVTKLSPNDVLHLDLWVVGLLLGPRELGYYAVALAALGPARAIPTGLSTVLIPMVSRAGIDRSVKRLVKLGAAGAILFSLVAIPLAGTIVPLAFGAEFAPAVTAIRILIVGSIVLTVRELVVALLYGSGRPGAASVVELVSATTLLSLLLPLSLTWGLNGASVALAVSYGAGMLAAIALVSLRGEKASRALGDFGSRVREIARRAVVPAGGLLVCIAGGWLVSSFDMSGRQLIVLVTALAVLGLILPRLIQRRYDPFEPISVFAFSMSIFLIMRPVAMLTANDFEWRGYNVMSMFEKGMLVGLLGVVAFLVGYYLPVGKAIGRSITFSVQEISLPAIAAFGAFCALLATAAVWLFYAQTGQSVDALFSVSRPTDDVFTRETVGYIYQAPLLCLPALLCATYLCKQGRYAVGTIIVGLCVPSVLYYYGQADRAVLTAIALQPVILLYLLANKRPSLILMTLGVVVLFFLYSGFRDARNDADDVGLTTALKSNITDLDNTWTSFGLGPDSASSAGLMFLVGFMPDVLQFSPGSSVSTLAVQGVPRKIWASKPRIPEEQIVEAAFPEAYARNRAGTTFTAMGTFYFDSREYGVAVGMLLSGIILSAAWAALPNMRVFSAASVGSSLPLLVFLFARASWPAAAVVGIWTIVPLILLAWLSAVALPALANKGARQMAPSPQQNLRAGSISTWS